MSDFHCDVVNLNRNKRESSGNERNCLIQKRKSVMKIRNLGPMNQLYIRYWKEYFSLKRRFKSLAMEQNNSRTLSQKRPRKHHNSQMAKNN